jgi:hypothetical protein
MELTATASTSAWLTVESNVTPNSATISENRLGVADVEETDVEETDVEETDVEDFVSVWVWTVVDVAVVVWNDVVDVAVEVRV